MPIMLDDLTASTTPVVTVYSPKFFNTSLTGNGKKQGLLQEQRNPAHVGQNVITPHDAIDPKRSSYKSGQTKVSMMPFFLISSDLMRQITTISAPDDLSDFTKIGTDATGQHDVYARMTIHSAVLSKTTFDADPITHFKPPTQTDFIAVWHLRVAYIDKTTKHDEWRQVDTAYRMARAIARSHYPDQDVFVDLYSANPKHDSLKTVVNELSAVGIDINKKSVADLVDHASLYDAISKRSEVWQNSIDKEAAFALKAVNDYCGGFSSYMGEHYAIEIMRRLESYPIPLGIYRRIYASMRQLMSEEECDKLCKENLNLLLSNTMNALDVARPQLQRFTAPDPKPSVDSKFSDEQAEAVTSDSPLCLVQSGAGTGKSTVILGRIKYMVDCGVDPNDITVLSFTNAAADHINECNPDVHSMTIARMIHSIYTLNYPNHDLSTEETLMNSIDIYLPNDPFAASFKSRLRQMDEGNAACFTDLNLFVEQQFDDVMRVLDACHQTTLNLEIVICYQKINDLQEPDEIQSKYLIIDEVQDNSIFEFVYTLKYVNKHKEALFIVGDASQTLFEFRGSNPRALNVMEGSDVFDTYRLQTNYRSNQEILDFANVALSDIEANQYANIRLHANDLTPVTAQSFKDKVKVSYQFIRSKSEMEKVLPNIFHHELKTYIDNCMAKNQQVTFLAYYNSTVKTMMETLTAMYPNATAVSIAPEKAYNSTVFSTFIRRYWNEVKFVPTASPLPTIRDEILNHLDRLVKNPKRARSAVIDLLCQWESDTRGLVKSWQAQINAGIITRDEMISNLRKQMLDYEIRHNAVKQSIVSNRNNDRKHNAEIAKADFLVSTIHSAKGLEFHNVVVIYDADKNEDEQFKRLYYVALTRAMNSEYIVAHGIRKTAPIVVDYETVIAELEKRDAALAQATAEADTFSDGVTVEVVEDKAVQNS